MRSSSARRPPSARPPSARPPRSARPPAAAGRRPATRGIDRPGRGDPPDRRLGGAGRRRDRCGPRSTRRAAAGRSVGGLRPFRRRVPGRRGPPPGRLRRPGGGGAPEVCSFLLERPEKLVLVYHNIPPAEYFLEVDPAFAALLADGRVELAAL